MKRLFQISFIALSLTLLSCSTKMANLEFYGETGKKSAGASTIEIPHSVRLMEINGEKQKTFYKFISSGKMYLTINPGKYTFLLKYQDIMPGPNGEDVVYKSNKTPVEITVPPLSTGKIFHQEIKYWQDAQKFEKNPEFEISFEKMEPPTLPNKEPIAPSNETKTSTPITESTNLEKLKDLFRQSSSEEQKEFLKWTIENRE